MLQYMLRFGFVLLLTYCTNTYAQGPPITGDKPIMLSGNSWVVKTLTEIRNTNEGTFVKAPLMVHYLPTSNTLVSIHIPFVTYDLKNEVHGRSLGDIEILGKYQFYRKDQKGKTFRMIGKMLQTLPTGNALEQSGISTGSYQNYVGVVAGYESIKYGISNEIGYNINPSDDFDELRYKLGFGLPLLKPTYPVNQVNLYFEYQNSWYTSTNEYQLLYAQGIQYAKGRFTIEAALQLPLVQTLPLEREMNYSVFLGTRYVY